MWMSGVSTFGNQPSQMRTYHFHFERRIAAASPNVEDDAGLTSVTCLSYLMLHCLHHQKPLAQKFCGNLRSVMRFGTGNSSDLASPKKSDQGRQVATAPYTEPDLHQPDPCTIFAAKAGFTSALLWSDSLIETTINDIPAGHVCVEPSNARSVFSSWRSSSTELPR